MEAPPTAQEPPGLFAGRIPLNGRSLRERTARGTIVNGAFQAGIVTLGLVKGLVVAVFLSVSDYGVWGILTVTLMSLAWLKQVGIGDRFIQQSDEDQRTAFQQAFTLELILGGLFVALSAVVLPPLSLVYGQSEIIAPGMALALALGLSAFQAPLWILQRRMEFARSRALQAVDPVVAFVVTVALAAAGVGYWSLVIGALAGAVAGSVAAVAASPYPLALTYHRGVARQYVDFTWPLLVAGATTIVMAQGAILVAEHELGLVAAGAITLSVTIAHYSDRVDEIITATIYPAICAVQDRADLLRETFVKSNRIGLVWAMPFGIGVSLFAAELVHHVLGDKWEPAIVLLRVFGLTAAFGHIGFNWTAFYRARGETRPIAVWSALSTLAFLAAAVPLLIANGLGGFAAGMGVVTAVNIAVKGHYLARLFSWRTVAMQGVRAVAPCVPAAAVVLLARLAGADGGAAAAAELAAYLLLVAAGTAAFERDLLRELARYLRGERAGAGPVAA
jgi:polysaccharide transporter, PST family